MLWLERLARAKHSGSSKEKEKKSFITSTPEEIKPRLNYRFDFS
jgi:hypothetical protein